MLPVSRYILAFAERFAGAPMLPERRRIRKLNGWLGKPALSTGMSGGDVPLPLDDPFEPLLDSPRQVLLPPQLDVRVVVGHVDTAVAGDLAGLDGTGPYLLPPGDVRTSERVQVEARKVVLGCSLQGLG